MGFVSEARAFAPSKRVGSLIIVVIAIVASVAIFRSEPGTTSTTPMRVTLSDGSRLRPTTEEKDSDGDNVKDWEEALWGLSSANPDSDSDGMGDAQEIESRKQAIADAPSLILNDIDPDAPKPSPTALAGQVLLSQFLTAKEAGVTLTEDSIAFASQIALGSTDLKLDYPTIGLADLTVTNQPITDRAYGNAIGTALTNTTGSPSPNELEIFVSYIQTSDADAFQKDMAGVIERYDATIDGFKKMVVPQERAASHLELTNALIVVRTDLANLAQVGSNPLMALSALDAYQGHSDTMIAFFKKLRASLSDIKFVQGEPGYEFIHVKENQ